MKRMIGNDQLHEVGYGGWRLFDRGIVSLMKIVLLGYVDPGFAQGAIPATTIFFV